MREKVTLTDLLLSLPEADRRGVFKEYQEMYFTESEANETERRRLRRYRLAWKLRRYRQQRAKG